MMPDLSHPPGRYTWREVAILLGRRMFNHAYCVQHPENADDPQCPYCEDRRTYRLFERKRATTT